METIASEPTHASQGVGARLDFRTIFEVEADFVARSLRRLGIRASDVEDATHEVFVALYSRLGDFDPARPMRAWIYGFIVRVAARERRRPFHRLQLTDTVPEQIDAAPNPEQAFAESENRKMVLAALEALEFDQRVVFVMHELDGIAIPEVAATTGVPVNTAYSRLRLARAAFAENVGKKGARS
jgi:RNA polymerase sigma-70 factor, ECF subfamily